MANLLQRLGVCLLAIAGAARAADFSHALHLKLIPDCFGCHTQALTSTKLADNLLPAISACTPCHERGKVSIKQPRELRLKIFNHAFHAKFGNVAPLLKGAVQAKTYLGDAPTGLDTRNACAACHHGIEQSTAASKSHFPQMPDCLVCHNKIDPPFSCETCHGVGDKSLKPAAHKMDYLDSHTRRSEKLGCAVCHGRQFTCLGCH